MSVILPPAIVTLSWTLPHGVETASEVTVLADDDPEDEDEDVGAAVADGPAAALTAAGAWAWKPSVATRPAAVAVRTMGARCMWPQKAKDSWCRWLSGTPAPRAAPRSASWNGSGPHTYTSRRGMCGGGAGGAGGAGGERGGGPASGGRRGARRGGPAGVSAWRG